MSYLPQISTEFEKYKILWKIRKPIIFFVLLGIRQHLPNVSFQHSILRRLFPNTTNFKLNSDIYAIFAPSVLSSLRKISIWEIYSVKSNKFYSRIRISHQLYPEGLIWMDGRVDRRTNFGGLGLTISARVRLTIYSLHP